MEGDGGKIFVVDGGRIIRSIAGAVSQVGEKVQRGKSGRYIFHRTHLIIILNVIVLLRMMSSVRISFFL